MGLRRQTEAKYWKVKWGRHYDHAAYLELLRAFATDIWGGGGQATARWIWNQVRLNARKFKLSKRDIRWMAKHLGGIMRIPTKGLYVKLAFLTYKNQACTNKWCCWGRFGLKCGFSRRRPTPTTCTWPSVASPGEHTTPFFLFQPASVRLAGCTVTRHRVAEPPSRSDFFDVVVMFLCVRSSLARGWYSLEVATCQST